MYEVRDLKHQKALLEVVQKYKGQKGKWLEITEELNTMFGTDTSVNTWKSRYRRIQCEIGIKVEEDNSFVIYGDGTVEANVIVNLTPEDKASPEKILAKMGYNITEWELEKLQVSAWQQHTKEQTTKNLYACKVRLKPRNKDIDPEEILREINRATKKGIEPLKLDKVKNNKELDNNKLLEQGPVEAHIGDLSCKMNTGENYDYKIGADRYRNVVERTCKLQEQEKCGILLLSIGGDLFNSDNETDTTTKGTQQHSDVRGNKMFLEVTKLLIEALKTYRPLFNRIDVQFVPGNHDSNNSFRLFVVLMYAFANDNKIRFIEDYKEVQCYEFGKCMILTTHGSKNVNKTMDSMPSEFAEIYGRTIYRELHMAHLHTEMELKERLGIIPRRTSTIKGIGEWEYNERFGRNIQKQMVFIWNKNTGLECIKMIPFERELDNQKTDRKALQIK